MIRFIPLIFTPFLLIAISFNGINALAQDVHPKTGLALSGGGAYGFAHIGVLKVMDSLGLKPDFITGTSMGSVVGGLYAIGYSATQIESLVVSTNWNEIFNDVPERSQLPYFLKKDDGLSQLDLEMDGIVPAPKRGLIYGQTILKILSRYVNKMPVPENFSDFPIPFACVAVDVITGNEVVITSGSLVMAMRSSMAVPTLFEPMEHEKHLLVDGGLLANVPTRAVKEMGAEKIMAVNLAAPLYAVKDLNSIGDILEQSINIATGIPQKEDLDIANLVLNPDLENYKPTDFSNAAILKLIHNGQVNARQYIDEIKTVFLPESYLIEKIPDYGPVIYGIDIKGNKELGFSFIYDLLQLTPGQRFSTDRIEEAIDRLYSMGYFEYISYQQLLMEPDTIKLQINVYEKTNGKLMVGSRYDEYYGVTLFLGYRGQNILFPGLRFESDLFFAGMTVFKNKLSYPSTGFNLPIYPYLIHQRKLIPTDIYDPNGKILAEYNDDTRELGVGLGVRLFKVGSLEVELNREWVYTKPNIAFDIDSLFPGFNEELNKFEVKMIVDNLDNLRNPMEGLFLMANFASSAKELDSDRIFNKFSMNLRSYWPLFSHHSLGWGLSYGISQGDFPVYKTFFISNPDGYIGLKRDQLSATRYGLIRMEHRYRFKPDIYFHSSVSSIFDYEYEALYIKNSGKPIASVSLGISVISLIGNIDIVYYHSGLHPIIPDQQQSGFYLTIGSLLNVDRR